MAQEEIEITVPVVVTGSHGEGRSVEGDSGPRSDVVEATVAAIREQPDGFTVHATNDQVEIFVAVEIREQRPAADAPRHRDTRLVPDLFEAPVAPVPEEEIRAQTAADDVQIDETIAVDVSARNPSGDPRLDRTKALRIESVYVVEPRVGRYLAERPRGRRGTAIDSEQGGQQKHQRREAKYARREERRSGAAGHG